MEGDGEGGFHGYGVAVFHGRLELPFRNGFAGVAIKAVVNTAQYADVGYGAVGADQAVEDDGAAYVLAHQFEGIGGVYFSGGRRRREIVCGGRRIARRGCGGGGSYVRL